MEDTIILSICTFWLGWFLSKKYRDFKANLLLTRLLEKIDEEDKPEDKIHTNFSMCYIEEDLSKMLRLYNEDTHKYMCQGKSYEELAEKVYTDLKMEVCLAKAGDTVMWFIRGEPREAERIS